MRVLVSIQQLKDMAWYITYSPCESCSVMSDSLGPHGLYSAWNSPGRNTGVGSLSLPQGIFPTQGSNPGLPHCRRILYQLSHKEGPRILEWIAYPFSSGSSRPRNWTGGPPALQADSLPTELWGKSSIILEKELKVFNFVFIVKLLISKVKRQP